jgi:hypothetical protein
MKEKEKFGGGKMKVVWKCEDCEKPFRNVIEASKHSLEHPDHEVHLVILY